MDFSHDLETALDRMLWELVDGRFALLGFGEPPTAADLALLGEGPGQLVREHGETTLLVPAARLVEARRRHPEARVEPGLAWIRFEAPMGWELVGFLAHVTGRLAAAGVPLGAVCGFSRDHLFVAEPHLERATAVLDELFPRVRGPRPDAHAGPKQRSGTSGVVDT